MEQKHQDIIRRIYSVLVKKMTATWVAERLFGDGIITEEMKENIITQKTRFEQSRKLISIILRRGTKAFIGFRKALLKSGHHDLSRLLLKDDDKSTLTDYEKTLAAARSLVIDVKSGTNTPKHGSETRCKIALDDKNDIFLTASVYNGNVNIHLRQFIEKNGQSMPTKKSVVFNLGRWVKFESLIEEIGEFLETYWKQSVEIQWHVGGGVFVSLTPKYSTVDIRHYWKPPDADKPLHTKKGVCLNRIMFNRLKASLSELHDNVPELSDVELCMFSESHRNQEGMLSCLECTPFRNESRSLSMECIASDSQKNNKDESEREEGEEEEEEEQEEMEDILKFNF
jgi:menaquinone-dependent protoporphyrinogen IX oxidase